MRWYALSYLGCNLYLCQQWVTVSLLLLGVLADVPSHLHYIMLELIKNSMRATVDFHGLDEMDNNPIRVVIADGEGNEVGFRLNRRIRTHRRVVECYV